MNDRHRRSRWLGISVLAAGLVLAWACVSPVRAQLTQTEEERLQILTAPDAVKKAVGKDRNRAPFEFFRSQVAPFDVLPYVKPNHWSTLTLEMRANDEDYDGYLQTDGMMLLTTPGSDPHLEVVYRREARLVKEQKRGLPLQVLLTRIPKEWSLDLVRPGALRPDATWLASLTMLEPHQMLILILSKDGANQFAAWNRMAALIPAGAERDNVQELDRLRYYRLVLPMEPDKPPLSSHPLTWSTISHVVWDGLPPDVLTISQQQALLDWLHWGGQLILTGGAGLAYPLYRESFLGPYLPAEATGETVGLSAAELRPLAQSYPPPTAPLLASPDNPDQALTTHDFLQRFGRIYQAPAPIQPATGKPVFLAVLRPGPGSATLPLGEASPHLLAVERRVGRGRITMLTINPTEPALAAWPGLDTLVRRVILRRPEEVVAAAADFDGSSYQPPQRNRLGGPDLTWYRLTSRDARPEQDAAGRKPLPPPETQKPRTGPASNPPEEPDEVLSKLAGVSDWRDTMRFPTLSRDLLEEASGITIPSSQFVLKVILAYLIAVVPLNWLVCRFLFNRREWAWVVVPLVALGFAVAVQRVAAYDMGFDSASDEIDLLEIQGDYHRAHLSRFASLYTSGRGSYSISYPDNPTAVALPLDNGRSIRGEDVTTSIWQSHPIPALVGLSVQPRSLSFFRAEEMAALTGAIRLEGEGTSRRIVNRTELELRDATLIDLAGPNQRTEHYLGTIAAGAALAIDPAKAPPAPKHVDFDTGVDPNDFLAALRTTWEPRDENLGELRLVAWTPRAMPGQVIEPAVDRRRGFTAVVVHLRCGPPPNPEGPRYNILALGPEKLPVIDPHRTVPPRMRAGFPRRGMPMPRRMPIPKKALMPPVGRNSSGR